MSPAEVPADHGELRVPGPIVLVGFMAAGKTTVGRLLARRLGWSFVDLDDRIAARTGRTPGAIIREDGEPAFRALEASETAELAGARELVLAPGGGWLEGGADRSLDGGVVVWLRIGVDEVLRRAGADPADRPLLGPPEGRADRVEALLRRREPGYARADVVVDVDGRDPDSIVAEILRRIGPGTEADER